MVRKVCRAGEMAQESTSRGVYDSSVCVRRVRDSGPLAHSCRNTAGDPIEFGNDHIQLQQAIGDRVANLRRDRRHVVPGDPPSASSNRSSSVSVLSRSPQAPIQIPEPLGALHVQPGRRSQGSTGSTGSLPRLYVQCRDESLPKCNGERCRGSSRPARWRQRWSAPGSSEAPDGESSEKVILARQNDPGENAFPSVVFRCSAGGCPGILCAPGVAVK